MVFPMNKFLNDVPHKHTFLQLLKRNYIDINTMIFSREVADKLLGKFEKLASKFYDWVFEDWLIALLTLRYSAPFYINDTYVLYRVHKENITYGRKELLERLFNIERSIKTLLAFYQIEGTNLNEVELECLRDSLFRHCIKYSRLMTVITEMPLRGALLATCKILTSSIMQRCLRYPKRKTSNKLAKIEYDL